MSNEGTNNTNDIQTPLPPVDPRTLRQQQITLRRPLDKQLYAGLLTNASATLYTAPAAPTVANSVGINPVAKIESIWISNTDSSARTVTLYLVESGGSIGASRTIFPTASIPANSTVELSPRAGFILEASGTLRGLASVTNVVCVYAFGSEHL